MTREIAFTKMHGAGNDFVVLDGVREELPPLEAFARRFSDRHTGIGFDQLLVLRPSIVLPDTAQEKPQRGKVVATGPGRLLDSGNRGEMSITVGDEVIFGKYGGSDVEVDGEEYKILRESDILARIV